MRFLYTLMFLLSAYLPMAAQPCGHGMRNTAHAAKTTVADPAENDYDVKYVKLNLEMTDASIAITGDVTTTAQVTSTSLSAYVFELESAYIIDSVLINGISMPVTSMDSIRTVSLTPSLSSGAMFSAQVFYHGMHTYGGSFFNGITNTSTGYGTNITFTFSEPWNSYQWWPCKQSLTDKIDSADIWVTVPNTLKAGSNGSLNAVTAIDASHVRYEWKERYPIDYYLIAISAATYTDYSYYMHFTGSSDSMLVQNYLYNFSSVISAYGYVIDSIGYFVDYLSSLYGRYPFWKEKYGYCMVPMGGGMENQTMTSISVFDPAIVNHELGHQWFGDNVSCASWKDIFNSEGFASYTEDIYLDHFRGHVYAINDIRYKQADVKAIPTGTIYVDDTTNPMRIFDGRLSYNKGACVLHMLRSIINNDSAFFQVYKNYQTALHGGTAGINDFKNVAVSTVGSIVNGVNLDTFFSQWAFREGYPIYSVSWNHTGSDVYIQITQTTAAPSSVALFQLPMELKLHSGISDTIVRVVVDQASQTYHFTWAQPMDTIIIDPNSWLVYNLDSVYNDVTLGISPTNNPLIKISPNPTTTEWQVTHLPLHSTLSLTDVMGRELWKCDAENTTVAIPAKWLSPGVYVLNISNNQRMLATHKLLKE